jgi:hypothetical protein
MAFVRVSKAEKYPAVIAKYAKNGQFRKAVKAEAKGSKSWAKRPNGQSAGSATLMVDPSAITGVKAMNPGGKKR